MAKRIHRKLTADERAKSRRHRKSVEAEKDRIIAMAQRVFERQERLLDTIRALKAEREAQGVSLGEMEQRTGIARSSLSRMENDPDANPTISTLMRIAEALGREITIAITDPKEAA